VDGDDLFQCSSLDKVILVWSDGRYQMMPPPEKLFVDKNLVYVGLFDRDKVMTTVYRSHGIAYIKRFTFGGAIMNKDYQCAPPGSKVLLFSDLDPEQLYVVYEPAKGQRIHQQIFSPRDLAVKGAKTLGVQMTVKDIKNLGVNKPRNWDDDAEMPRGAPLK
jgi:topoisomerase-4 subunit A